MYGRKAGNIIDYKALDDSFFVRLNNLSSTQAFTVNLFSNEDDQSSGQYATNYQYIIASAAFPLSGMTIEVDTVPQSINGGGSVTAATLLTSLTALGFGTWYHYASGSNEVYYIGSNDHVFGNMAGFGLPPLSPTITSNVITGTEVEVSASNPDYLQIVHSMIGQPYLIKSVYADVFSGSQSQAVQVLEFFERDSDGRKHKSVVSPVVEPYQQQNMVVGKTDGQILDSNATIDYKMLASAEIQLYFQYKRAEIWEIGKRMDYLKYKNEYQIMKDLIGKHCAHVSDVDFQNINGHCKL